MTFSPREPGNAPETWRLAGLPTAPWPAAGDHVILLSAHPDDETLGAGGLIAGAASRGARITVVVATDGEHSHPHSPTTTPSELAVIRRREMRAALDRLAGDAELHFLGLPDGGLAATGDAAARFVQPWVAGVTHVVSPLLGDGHPDHDHCARVAAELALATGAEHWSYPVWTWHWGDPDGGLLDAPDVHALPLGPDEYAAKQAALAEHRSQHTPLSEQPGDEAILPPHVLAHFHRDVETFRVRPATPAARTAYFDALYAADPDPWGLADRFYEQRKRDLLLASLPRRRFVRAFEPGCSGGWLTERLAARCDRVVAWDASEAAVTSARERAPATVELAVGRIPEQWPNGELDLVVLSEIAYYVPDLDRLVERIDASLATDGVVVACHWRHPAPDHPHTADEVHRALRAGFTAIANHVERDFVLDVLTRDGRSVAQAEGIV